MSDSTAELGRRIETACRNAVDSAKSLTEALQACEGLFPTLAVQKFFEIDRARTQLWLEQAATDTEQLTTETGNNSSFILSTWEFREDQTKSLSSVAWRPGSRVCLLGTPSLVRHLPIVSRAGPHILVDLRAPASGLPNNVIHLAYDINSLNGRELAGAFDACFLDPPWYVENYLKWIDVARSYCHDGGTIAFALLGRLTRPSAVDDREQILQHCSASGLSVEVYKERVLYKPPAFERHMLRRAGIPSVFWKRADLVIATCNHENVLQNRSAPAVQLIPFNQTHLAGITIEVVFDRYEQDIQENLLVPQGGYWMQTPSRREPGLKDCNVFTSNGARFISPRPIDLFGALVSLQQADSRSIRDRVGSLGFPLEVFGDRLGVFEHAL